MLLLKNNSPVSLFFLKIYGDRTCILNTSKFIIMVTNSKNPIAQIQWTDKTTVIEISKDNSTKILFRDTSFPISAHYPLSAKIFSKCLS